jgi:hypothetical protein
VVYFGLRVANQEFASWRFQPMKHWLREERLPAASVAVAPFMFWGVHLLVSMLVCAPPLVWAGAIARAQPAVVLSTLVLLLFYSLCYAVWGLVTLAWWERKVENRQVFVRCFFFFTAIISALLYLPLNPVAYLLAYLGREELPPLAMLGWNWSATTVHFGFHLLLFGLGLALYHQGLKRGGSL